MTDPRQSEAAHDPATSAAGSLAPQPPDAVVADTPVPIPPDQPAVGVVAPETAREFDERIAELAPLYAAAGRVLTWGFRLAAALLAAGLLLALVRDEPLAEQAEPLPEVIDLLRDGHGAGLVDLAIIAMVLTPVVTVLALAAGFLRLGDGRYALASFVVLAILGVSVALSLLR